MACDGSETRARLLVEAERLFAEVGVLQAATGDIVRAAGQRNASALTYHFGSGKGHFGSRQGVLDAILADTATPSTPIAATCWPRSPPTHRTSEPLSTPWSAP